jgi:hypothetical protein
MGVTMGLAVVYGSHGSAGFAVIGRKTITILATQLVLAEATSTAKVW